MLGIVQTLLTCGVNLLFGALGATFAFVGKSEWDRGEYDSAVGRLRLAKIFNLIGLAVFALLAALVTVFRIVAGSGSPPLPLP